MLEYTQGGGGARFMLLVLHDDAAREYAYGPARRLPDVKLGAFTPALYEEAKKESWTVVSMKNDWKTVFPGAQSEVARLLTVFPKGWALDAAHHAFCLLLFFATSSPPIDGRALP